MTIEQVIQKQCAQPFQPYRMHLADGRTVDVKHPEFLARSPEGRTVALYSTDETSEVIDLLLVVSLEDINGKVRGPKRLA